MNSHRDTSYSVRLQQGELMASPDAGARVKVLAGRVWITQAGDLVDHFLHHGQCFELRHSRHALIGAEDEVWLHIEPPRRPGWPLAGLWRRLRRRLTVRATPAATVAG
jgi:hypothetical protein